MCPTAQSQILHLLQNFVAGLVVTALGHTSVRDGCPLPSLHPEVSVHLGYLRQFLKIDPKCGWCMITLCTVNTECF